MKTPALALGLLLLFGASDASALQLGQMTARSRLGEALEARIELYGLTAASGAALRLELQPDIGSPADSAARATVAALAATVAFDQAGQPYIALSSHSQIDEPVVNFRLRAGSDGVTMVRHYTLALLPAPSVLAAAEAPARRRAAARPAPRVDIPQAPMLPAGEAANGAAHYGPVRPGQSLWRILQENGLATGDVAGTIARIVGANPHAFIAGDANRLRLGVMLNLVGTAATSATQVAAADVVPSLASVPAASSVPAVAAPAVATPAPSATATTPDTAARLVALEEKFAAIRARYAAQRASQDEPSASIAVSPTVTVADAPPAALPESGTAASLEAPTGAVEAARPTAGRAALTPYVPFIAAGVIVMLLGIAAVRYARQHSRRRVHTAAYAADQHLVKQISAKAEKRLQLEDEVKRTIKSRNGNGHDTQPATVAPPAQVTSTIERFADHQVDPRGLEEIETRIAYGQYAEAEALLREVLSRVPHNHRAKLRLAEIYYLNERHDEFVAMATEIHRLHRADIEDDDWQRIMRMGKVIAPERPPFSGPLPIESARDVG